MPSTDGQLSHRSSAWSSRIPKSVVCIIATSGRQPDLASPAPLTSSQRPGLSFSSSPSPSTHHFSPWSHGPNGQLPCFRPLSRFLMFLGLSRQQWPSSTESDEVLAKDTVTRPKVCRSDRLFWVALSRVW